MSNVTILLDKAVKTCSPANYNGLATRLNVSRSLVSAWKTGKFPFPQERIAEVARIAHQDAGDWLVLIEAEQARGEAKKAYGSLARRLGIAALLALLCAPVLASTNAAGSPAIRINPAYCLLCSTLRHLARFLITRFQTSTRRISHGQMLALQG
jgi:hypothetical protein